MTTESSHRSTPTLLAAHSALAGAQIAFGLFPVVGTLAFRPGGLTPLAIGAWRISGGALALGLFAAARFRSRMIPRRTDLVRLAVCALLGVAINQGLFLIGLSLSTPMNAGLVMALIPVFTFAVAGLARQEVFSPLRLVGVVIALGGIAPLVLTGGVGVAGSYAAGNLLMMGNALAYSIFLVLSKPLMLRYPSIVVTAWCYVFSLVAVPYFAWGAELVPASGHGDVWWSLGYIVVFPTIVSYVLSMYALARLRASTTAVYVYTQPVITGVGSWIVLSERPSSTMVVTVVMLFVGIWLVARRPPPAPAPDNRRVE